MATWSRSAQVNTLAFVSVVELFLFGFTLGLFYVGIINPSFLSRVNSSLALGIVGGLWGGLIVVSALAIALWSYSRHAAREEDASNISKSTLRRNNAIYTSLTLTIKTLGAVSGFAVITGGFAIASPMGREALELTMAGSIAIAVAGILGALLSAYLLSRLASFFNDFMDGIYRSFMCAGRADAAASRRGKSADELVYGWNDAMILSGPISIVVAATTECLLTVESDSSIGAR